MNYDPYNNDWNNDQNDQNNGNGGFGTPMPEPELTPEETKRHKAVFSCLCLSFLAYLVISNGLALAASYILAEYFPQYANNYNVSIVLSSVIQYVIAFPVLVLMLRRLPKTPPVASRLGVRRFLKYAVASIFIMYVGNYISTIIMTYMESALGSAPENSVDTLLGETNILLSIVLVGIVGPIVEELMFRKLAIDRLTPYGDAVAVILPSLIFGLFHGNLYQLFYAFLLGMAFSYIYVRTGRIIYSTVLHIFINLFCGVLPSAILGMMDYEELIELVAAGALTEEYIAANMLPIALLGVYELAMLVMITAGVIVLGRNIKNIHLDRGSVRIPKHSRAEIMFGSIGSVALIAVCVIIIALNTFAG